jgi:peroxiredoxin
MPRPRLLLASTLAWLLLPGLLAPAPARAASPAVGTAAPKFRLQDQSGRWVTLDEQHSLPFPILADTSKSTARAYGVLYRALGLLELARRETFVIDPQGRVARHCTQVDPKGHPQTVLADLTVLQGPGGQAAHGPRPGP